jgi:hypothetical protein
LGWHSNLATDTRGGQFHPDFTSLDSGIVALEHLGIQRVRQHRPGHVLKRHRTIRIAFIGMRANTCIDSTRFGQQLGHHVTLIRDAIGAFGDDEMRGRRLRRGSSHGGCGFGTMRRPSV